MGPAQINVTLKIAREAWHAAIQGVAKGRTWLKDWTELKNRQASQVAQMVKNLPINAEGTGDMGVQEPLEEWNDNPLPILA